MSAPTTAVVLAAGMGTRLRSEWADLPKALLAFGGETLIQRTLRLLRGRGVVRVVVVVGYSRASFAPLGALPDVELVDNARYASTGTLASLCCALGVVDTSFLLLESDLLYEPRALDVVLADPRPDLVLGSGPTRAGDEVWIEATGDRLVNLSKDRGALGQVAGELVGICKISASLAVALRDERGILERARGDDRASYETDGLVAVARSREIAVRVVPDLVWGEVDFESHYVRLRDEVMPRLVAAEQGR